MKLLHEISQKEYDAGRILNNDLDVIVERTEDSENTLFVARFLVPGAIAVEGLVGVQGVFDDDTVRFCLANEDGGLDSTVNKAPISEGGILGSLMLRDIRVLRVQEGYFHTYSSELDEELMSLIALQQRELVPVHVTNGGAYGDEERRRLAA